MVVSFLTSKARHHGRVEGEHLDRHAMEGTGVVQRGGRLGDEDRVGRHDPVLQLRGEADEGFLLARRDQDLGLARAR
jgi:hypothetical protein